MPYRGRTHFRTTRGMLVFTIIITAITLVISVVSTTQGADLWVITVCWGVFFLCLVAIADLLVSFVTLGDKHFRMRRNFRVSEIPRADIQSIAAEKGCPTLLLLHDGSKVEIPELGGQGIANSVRAWLKAT